MRSGVRGLLVALLLATLAGCASAPPEEAAPPVPELPPQPGDTFAGIVERGYQLLVAYQFMIDGHSYAFANAYAGWQTYDLVFIDGQLACGEPHFIGDVTDWEWVGEADGLAYLAGRLRQACGLEEPTPARPSPALASTGGMAPGADGSGNSSSGTDADEFFREHPFAEALAAGVVVTVGLVWGPFMWLPGLVVESVSGQPSTAAVDPARAHVRELGLSVTVDDVVKQFGRPQVTFVLPRAATTVIGYGVDKPQSLYVGFAEGHAIWIHGYYPWLKDLAKQALAEEDQRR